MPTPHGIPLGPGPRPSTGGELAARLRAAATASLTGLPFSGLDTAVVDAELDGADIVSLSIDLSGVEIDLPAVDSGIEPAGGTPSPEASRTGGELRSGRIQAHPAVLAGAPVDLDVRLSRLRIAWIERTDGTTDLDAGDDDLEAMSGSAEISIGHEHLPAIATVVLNTALADAGASVSDVAITIASAGEDAGALDATAKARYGVMSASVRLQAQLRIVDGRRMQLTGVDLSTKNLLAGALLGLARGELEKLEGQEFDLVELLPAGVRDPRVHLDVGSEAVSITASFGG